MRPARSPVTLQRRHGSGGNLQIHSGTETLTGTNGYSGDTIIDGSGVLALSGSGDISASDVVTDNGKFDITQSSAGVSITTLSGASTSHVYLGNNTLTLTSASGTYNGVISNSGGIVAGTTGGLTISGGSEILGNAETYTGDTTIASGAFLHLSGAGSLAYSSVVDNGTLDISVAGGSSSILSLSGASTGKVTLGGNLLTINDAQNQTFSGVISGANGSVEIGYTVEGTETLTGKETFSGVNTYTGLTTIDSSATLYLDTAGSIADSSEVADNGTFDIHTTSSGASIKTLSGSGHVDLGSKTLTLTNASTTFSGIIEDGLSGTAGGLTINGLGSVETLTGANTYTGTTTITLGTLKAGAANAFSQYSDVVMAADPNAVLDLSGSGYNQTIKSLSGSTVAVGGTVKLGANTLTITNGSNGGTWDGTISGSGGIHLTTGGTFTVDGANTYTGTTTIASGTTLALTGSGNISQSSLVTDDGTFSISAASSSVAIKRLAGASTGAVTLGSNTLSLTAANDTFYGVINGGSGGFTVSSGSETLSAKTNNYTGLTSVGSGAHLYLDNNDDISNSSGVNDIGTFDIQTNGNTSIKTLYGNGVVQLGVHTLTLTAAGPAGTGSFSGFIHGSGGLTITGGTETLSGNNDPTINDYAGATTLTSGTLKAGVNDAFSPNSAVSIAAAGILDLNSHNETIYSLDGTGSVALGTGTLTITHGGSYGGSITGGGGIDVAGSLSNFTLTAADTYSGVTTIESGNTLTLSGGSIVNSIVDDNGTLDVHFGNASIQSLRDSAGPGAVTLGIGDTFALTSANDTFDGVISGGDGTSTFEIASGVETLTGGNTYTGNTKIDSGAVLKLTGTGNIADSALVQDDGNFDISGTTSGATIVSLKGTSGGIVTLGSQTLTISNTKIIIDASNTFNGTINGGTGGLTIAAGQEELTGTQNYNGTTSIDSPATLVLGATGDIHNASSVADDGSFIINANTSIKSLSGSGTVTLNGNKLTITNAVSASAADYFSGDIGPALDAGSLTIAGGTQTLSGTNAYTGATTIGSSATLAIIGATSVATSSGVDVNGTFDISGTTAGTSIMSLSGNGAVHLGDQVLTITNAAGNFSGIISGTSNTGGIHITGGTGQTLTGVNTYTGATVIDLGAKLTVSGSGRISTSSNVTDNGTFDISGASSGTIVSLSGRKHRHRDARFEHAGALQCVGQLRG